MSSFDSHVIPSRYLTADVPGTGGVIKRSDADFIVEELPAYHPSGEGEHLYLWVQKTHMATMHVVRMLADHFAVKREAVGFAGLKDKIGVTTQMFSIHLPGKKESEFKAFEHPNVAVLWMDRHGNKLRRGHLNGNRFVIRVRDVEVGKVVHAHRALGMLARLGVPNRIGSQRFGVLGNNHEVGRALLLGDAKGAVDAMLMPSEKVPPMQAEPRGLYAQGKYDEAMRALTGGSHTERRVLNALARGAKFEQAVREIERVDYGFYITAWQSAIFNRVLDERIEAGRIASLGDGDLAFKHDSGAVFAVSPGMSDDERGALEGRLKAMEISPSGPMWGKEMTRASGEVGDGERRALEETGITEEMLGAISRRNVESMVGQRRALRVPLKLPDVEGGVDAQGAYIKCVFELPRGAFATTVMQEIMKGGSGELAVGSGEDEELGR